MDDPNCSFDSRKNIAADVGPNNMQACPMGISLPAISSRTRCPSRRGILMPSSCGCQCSSPSSSTQRNAWPTTTSHGGTWSYRPRCWPATSAAEGSTFTGTMEDGLGWILRRRLFHHSHKRTRTY